MPHTVLVCGALPHLAHHPGGKRADCWRCAPQGIAGRADACLPVLSSYAAQLLGSYAHDQSTSSIGNVKPAAACHRVQGEASGHPLPVLCPRRGHLPLWHQLLLPVSLRRICLCGEAAYPACSSFCAVQMSTFGADAPTCTCMMQARVSGWTAGGARPAQGGRRGGVRLRAAAMHGWAVWSDPLQCMVL